MILRSLRPRSHLLVVVVYCFDLVMLLPPRACFQDHHQRFSWTALARWELEERRRRSTSASSARVGRVALLGSPVVAGALDVSLSTIAASPRCGVLFANEIVVPGAAFSLFSAGPANVSEASRRHPNLACDAPPLPADLQPLGLREN